MNALIILWSRIGEVRAKITYQKIDEHSKMCNVAAEGAVKLSALKAECLKKISLMPANARLFFSEL